MGGQAGRYVVRSTTELLTGLLFSKVGGGESLSIISQSLCVGGSIESSVGWVMAGNTFFLAAACFLLFDCE